MFETLVGVAASHSCFLLLAGAKQRLQSHYHNYLNITFKNTHAYLSEIEMTTKQAILINAKQQKPPSAVLWLQPLAITQPARNSKIVTINKLLGF
jgi:hypothetical protein